MANKGDTENTDWSREDEADLDKTSNEIPLSQSGELDQTKTSIRAPVTLENIENTDKTPLPKKNPLGFLKRIKIHFPQKPHINFPRFFSKIKPSNIFTSSFSGTLLGKIRALIVSSFCFAGGLLFLGLLGLASWKQWQLGMGPTFYLVVGTLAIIFLFSFLALVLGRSWVSFLKLPLVGFLGLMAYQLFFWGSGSSGLFSYDPWNLAVLLNHIFLLLWLFQILYVLFIYPHSVFLKIILVLLGLYGIAGFVENIRHRVLLEASWYGSGFLEKIPFVWAQPVFVNLHVLGPLFLIVALCYAILLRRHRNRAWIFWNVPVLLLVSANGLLLLQNNRVDNALEFFWPKLLMAGSLEIQTKDLQLNLATKNFVKAEGVDTVGRYQIKLAQPVNAGTPQNYLVKVQTMDGLPVFFLEKNDFDLWLGNKLYADWSLTPVFSPNTKSKNKVMKAGVYELQLKTQPVFPQIALQIPPQGSIWFKDQSIRIDLLLNDADNVFMDVSVDGKVLAHETNLASRSMFEFPATDLDVGKHFLEVLVENSRSLQKKISQEIEIKAAFSFAIASPMEGDFFMDALPVFIHVGGVPSSDKAVVNLLLNGKTVGEKSETPYSFLVPTQDLPASTYDLTVNVVTQSGGTQTKTVKLAKGVAPQVSFVSPGLGEFVPVNLSVEAKVSAETPASKLELYMDGSLVKAWDVPPYKTDLDTSSWQEGVHILTLRAYTLLGATHSQSITVSGGVGELSLSVAGVGEAQEMSSPFKKIVFVLDASVSQYDAWSGKTKWEWITKLFSLNEIFSKFKSSQVGIVVSGSRHGYAEKNCRDATLLSPMAPFNVTRLRQKLREVTPLGNFSLLKALEMAFLQKPQKIIVLTDGLDACSFSSDVLEKNKTSLPVIDFVVLGKQEKDQEIFFDEIAKRTSGQVVRMEKGEDIQPKTLELLSIYYQVTRGSTPVLSSPLDGQTRSLRSGNYTLKIFSVPPAEEISLEIKNGLHHKIELFVEGQKTLLKQATNPF
ncbi:MAG TPA: hypothetical protein DDW49_11110 [Deltaproteobacteria bacterium]|nr:MAG: hypothetical protein A2048_02065 [Deltaproteobacteria bacterium GWA2_45_12]HBF13914.1 hypothetical protein [Deltaproteobacteria bacterium]